MPCDEFSTGCAMKTLKAISIKVNFLGDGLIFRHKNKLPNGFEVGLQMKLWLVSGELMDMCSRTLILNVWMFSLRL